MTEISFDRPAAASLGDGVPGPKTGATQGPAGFADLLGEALKEVDDAQARSASKVQQFAAGEDVELHNVLLEMQKADLSFRTLMEMRNKIVEAYREIMRLPI